MTIDEAIKSTTNLRGSFVLDVSSFQYWCMEQYSMENNEWHKKVWRKGLCDRFMDDDVPWFEKRELTEEENEDLDEAILPPQFMINEFLDAHPELEGTVGMAR